GALLAEFATGNIGPFSIRLGPDNNLWFSGWSGNRLVRMTTAGVMTSFTMPTTNSQPYVFAFGPDNNIYVDEFNANKIARFPLPQNIVAAATSRLVVTPPPTVLVNNNFNYTVAAEDQFGNITPNYTGTVVFSLSDAAASNPSSYSFVSADQGVHTIT